MDEQKRPVDIAYKSFLDSAEFTGSRANNYADGISKKLSGGNDWRMLEKLYKLAYEQFPTEKECNKAVCDFIRDEWSRGSSYVRNSPLKAFSEYAERVLDRPTETKTMTSSDAEALSRPGSVADKGIGPDTGKAVKDASAEAFMNEQKKTAKYEKSSGVELSPETNLSGYADAVSQVKIINQITGVTVAPENEKAVQKAVEALVKEGNYSDARKCKQAAVNIDYIFSKLRGTTDGDKVFPLFLYVRGILDFNWFEKKQMFGKKEDDELKKLYKSIEKRYASMGNMSPSDKMKLLKDISDAYSKEWAWYSSLDENDDAAVHNSESRQGLEKDDNSGYRGMWVNGTVNALDGLLDLSTTMLTINAYLSNQPWPSSDMVDEENGITWKQLFEGLKEYFTKPTMESAKAEARRRASDSYIEDADSAGIGPQGETVPTEDDTGKESPWSKVADAAKAAGKSFASGKGLIDVVKDTANAARGD